MAEKIDDSNFIKVDSESNLPLGKLRRVEVGQYIVAIWHLEDGYFAIDDECPHQGDSLSMGTLEGNGTIACPWHGAQFEIRTGKVLSLPATCGVRTFHVKLVDGDVYISKQPKSDAKPQSYELK